MEATLTLNQAGRQLGVDDGALSRLIQMGALPEATQVDGDDGPMWVIPERQLPRIAARNGWTIDLRGNGSANGGPARGPIDKTNAIVVREAQAPVPTGSDTATGASANGDLEPANAAPSVAEVLDLALLDRLLGVQEERATAQAEVRESRHALAALNDTHNRVTGELEVERRERLVAADRFREERMARAISDAKVAELRDRVVREMAMAEAEKAARVEAQRRSSRAERDAANAFASMGWLARRRFRRLSGSAVDPA